MNSWIFKADGLNLVHSVSCIHHVTKIEYVVGRTICNSIYVLYVWLIENTSPTEQFTVLLFVHRKICKLDRYSNSQQHYTVINNKLNCSIQSQFKSQRTSGCTWIRTSMQSNGKMNWMKNKEIVKQDSYIDVIQWIVCVFFYLSAELLVLRC